MIKKEKIKFEFSIEFQLEILRYLIRDKEAGLVIGKIKPSYLTLIEHSLIAEGLIKYYKSKHVMPSLNVLKEVLRELLTSKQYVDLVTKDDIPSIYKILNGLYKEPLKDSEYIRDKIYQFATYVEVKKLNENFDLTDFGQYENYSNKLDKILRQSKPRDEDAPSFLIKDMVERQFLRQSEADIIPCPSKQLNNLTNAGGFPRSSVIVLLDKPKAKKTFFLIHMAKGYLRMKKSVLYIDCENGKTQIMDRFVQSSINKTKKELYSGEFDAVESRHLRKLSRLGVELIVDRVPAMITDCNYIKEEIRNLRQQGINIKVLMIDYAAKLASISGDKDDFERVSNIYVDIQNLAEEMKLDCIWTANHITRDGAKHRTTRYEERDIAGAISIVRNAQCILGLNATEQEEQEHIQRLEVVVNRDGVPYGRALFKVDVDRQRAVEFTKAERDAYDKVYGDHLDEELKKKINPHADSDKASKITGDI